MHPIFTYRLPLSLLLKVIIIIIIYQPNIEGKKEGERKIIFFIVQYCTKEWFSMHMSDNCTCVMKGKTK